MGCEARAERYGAGIFVCARGRRQRVFGDASRNRLVICGNASLTTIFVPAAGAASSYRAIGPPVLPASGPIGHAASRDEALASSARNAPARIFAAGPRTSHASKGERLARDRKVATGGRPLLERTYCAPVGGYAGGRERNWPRKIVNFRQG
jgi:hypothetical protein